MGERLSHRQFSSLVIKIMKQFDGDVLKLFPQLAGLCIFWSEVHRSRALDHPGPEDVFWIEPSSAMHASNACCITQPTNFKIHLYLCNMPHFLHIAI